MTIVGEEKFTTFRIPLENEERIFNAACVTDCVNYDGEDCGARDIEAEVRLVLPGDTQSRVYTRQCGRSLEYGFAARVWETDDSVLAVIFKAIASTDEYSQTPIVIRSQEVAQ